MGSTVNLSPIALITLNSVSLWGARLGAEGQAYTLHLLGPAADQHVDQASALLEGIGLTPDPRP